MDVPTFQEMLPMLDGLWPVFLRYTVDTRVNLVKSAFDMFSGEYDFSMIGNEPDVDLGEKEWRCDYCTLVNKQPDYYCSACNKRNDKAWD
jgi:hypothetical protein